MTSNLSQFYWTNFNSLWDTLTTGIPIGDTIRSTPKKDLTSLPSYPHSNCWLSEDMNVLNLEFALAGFKEKDLSVKSSGSQLRVEAKSARSEDASRHGTGLIHNGISQKDIDFTLGIDEVYDVKTAKVKFEDGILSITMSRHATNEVTKLF